MPNSHDVAPRAAGAPDPSLGVLIALGWDDDREADLTLAVQRRVETQAGTPELIPGRVVRVERGRVVLQTAVGRASVLAVDLAVGDWVVTDGHDWAEALPRRSELRRKEAGATSGEQLLAANVEVVVIVEPMAPAPSRGRIERMVTLAWGSGATPLVVLTKADLGTGDEVAEVASIAVGVDVLAVCAADGSGLDELRERLPAGRTFVLLGPSGAGKSTLVNALAGQQVLLTGEVRGDGRGKHTTTHRELVLIPGLGCLIDTPGIRGVGMVSDESGLDRAFEDVIARAEQCRFADCSHESEPGCEVRAAIATDELDAARLIAYRHLLREIAFQARRKGVRDRAEVAVLKKRTRNARAAVRAKGKQI